VFWTATIQKNILILAGILALSYVLIFLLAPKNVADYTIADTEYWRETGNRLLLKTVYEYNSKEDIKGFPKTIGEWDSIDFKYSDAVYAKLNADILMSRAYKRDKDLIWMDIINSKVGESFHKQKICVEGAGWNIDRESIAQFTIADEPNPYTKLYANRLDISKEGKKQIMVYWFMFKKFGSGNDAVTMIRISAPILSSETETFDYIKDFVEDRLFNTMYEDAIQEDVTVAEYMVSEYGKLGIFAIILMVLVPIGIVFIGIRQKD